MRRWELFYKKLLSGINIKLALNGDVIQGKLKQKNNQFVICIDVYGEIKRNLLNNNYFSELHLSVNEENKNEEFVAYFCQIININNLDYDFEALSEVAIIECKYILTNNSKYKDSNELHIDFDTAGLWYGNSPYKNQDEYSRYEEYKSDSNYDFGFDTNENLMYLTMKLNNMPAIECNGITIKPDSSISLSEGTEPSYSLQMTTTCSIMFKFSDTIQLDQKINFIQKYLKLMSFCYGRRTQLYSVYVNDNTKRDSDICYILFAGLYLEPTSLRREKSLFRYKDVQNVQQLFDAWFENIDSLDYIIDLYLDAKQSEDNYYKLLKVLQAIEVFSRLVDGYNIDAESSVNYKNFRELEICDKELSSWLISKLSFSQEPVLKQRLIKELDNISIYFPINFNQNNKLLNKIVAVRNFYTHFSKEAKSKMLTDFNDVKISQCFWINVLEIRILQCLSFSEAEIQNILCRTNFANVCKQYNKLNEQYS